ncbi:MAG: ribosome rescue protein RqcH [Candidatus Bathyarchaeota archaeon]|nr:ribosome rescue protein RqcH [Candidatus Bathyarchaeota archaeon]
MRKKEFSSFDISAVTQELKEHILDSRVNNIYQFDQKTLVFRLHKTDLPPIRLVIEAGRRLHTTVYAEESPAQPPPFCMTMRKYLRGAWLAGIEQYQFERIVTVDFRTKTGLLKLTVELFGEGNLILTNEQNVIISAMEFKRMRDRNILHGEQLVFPPAIGKNPFEVTKTTLADTLKESGDTEVVRAMARSLGLGGVYSEEILQRADIDKTRPCKTLQETDFDAIFGCLEELLSKISNHQLEPNIVLDEQKEYVDVVPFKLKRYESYQIQLFPSFSEALDQFFLRVITAEKAVASVEVDNLKKEAQRLSRMVEEQEKSIREDQARQERDQQIGNTIYAHLSELQIFLDKLHTANRQGLDWISIAKEAKTQCKFVESFDGKNLALNMCLDGYHFCLNLRDSLYDNANQYYEKSKRAKQKSEGATFALEDSKRKLAKIQKELDRAEELKTLKPAQLMEALAARKIESKEWFQKFRWFTSSDGFLVVAGKDVVSNEVLIKKHATDEDVVFHAEITGSPFVVIKAEGKPISEQALKEAGEYAASFSRAWRENAGSADVYWVKPEQLSKSGPSGESVPHGAFFVVGKRNWMRGTPLKLAIGVSVGEKAEFFGGPVDAVSARTKSFILILPGDVQGKELLTRVLKSLMYKLPKEQRERAGKTSIEQVREFVPYTKASIIDKLR